MWLLGRGGGGGVLFFSLREAYVLSFSLLLCLEPCKKFSVVVGGWWWWWLTVNLVFCFGPKLWFWTWTKLNNFCPEVCYITTFLSAIFTSFISNIKLQFLIKCVCIFEFQRIHKIRKILVSLKTFDMKLLASFFILVLLPDFQFFESRVLFGLLFRR